MEYEKLKANRKKALKILDNLKDDAYSSLTCTEYHMIQCTYLYIKMRQKLDDEEAILNGKEV